MSGRTFTQLVDKALTADVVVASWCPTMDVLALATADGQLCLYRLNWQRLWMISPDANVTALCWRPDGKALAAGHEDGQVVLLDVENGEVVQRERLFSSAITCLSWVEEAEHRNDSDTCAYQPRAPRFCAPPPAPLPTPGAAPRPVYGPAPTQARSPGAGRWPAETEQLAVLCAADKTGHISCTAFGLFPIAFLDLKANGCHIAKATISPDLSRLYVLWHDKPSGNSNGWLNMSIYSTQSIEARRHELHHVAMLASHALALLDGAQQTLSACEREWRDAMEAMAGKLAVLEGLLRDHASHAKPQEEFICLLACGALSAALHQFLATNLGEAGVKRLAKAVDAAATSLGGLLVDHLQPTLEVVAFHLADLQGLAACRRWLGPIGLQEDALQTAAGGAAQLLVRVEAVRLAVCRAGAQYRLFFAWLLRTIRRLNDETRGMAEPAPRFDTQQLSHFLHGQFQEDVLAPEFRSQAGRCPPRLGPGGTCLEAGQPLLSAVKSPELAELLQLLIKAPTSATASLYEQLQGLTAACQTAFSNIRQAVSPAFTTLLQLPLCPVTSIVAITTAASNSELAPGAFQTCFHAATGGSAHPSTAGVFLVRLSPGEGAGSLPVIEVAALAMPEGTSVVDVAFYRNAQMAVLTSDITGVCQLLLQPTQDLRFTPMRSQAGSQAACEVCTAAKAVVQVSGSARMRRSGYSQVHAPLIISGPRGVACVLAGTQRGVLYDLEEDEDEQLDNDEDSEEAT